jgi:hypothetical protein
MDSSPHRKTSLFTFSSLDTVFAPTPWAKCSTPNKALGGCATDEEAKALYRCVKQINANFEGGETDNGFLGQSLQ